MNAEKTASVTSIIFREDLSAVNLGANKEVL